MIGQLFWAATIAYLYLVGTSLYRLFFPTQCGSSTHPLYCVKPLLQQGASAVGTSPPACVLCLHNHRKLLCKT